MRPHRATGRRTPSQAFAARTEAVTRSPGLAPPGEHRVRRDRIGSGGNVTLRYQSRLQHLGVGRRYAGTRVLLLVADRDVRVINLDGELLAEVTIDPNKDYQTQVRPGRRAGLRPGCHATPVRDVSRHNTAPPAGFEPATHGLGNRRSIP